LAQIDFQAGPASTSARAFWLKHLYRWHWISAALCLVGMLLFAITGFTLNHAGQIEAAPQVVQATLTLPAPLRASLAETPDAPLPDAPLPYEVARWIGAHLPGALPTDLRGRPGEWSSDDVYVALPRPGGDAWLSINRQDGSIEYERTDRGLVSYLNDLHKGRNTGRTWSLFLDLFAAACLIFCITGLFILHMHAAARRSTWPLVAAGLVIPVMLAILFIH
jgi:uncharacterized protein